eukprot:gnl/MRDRNA2_/MRDRNA2_84607_c0_seq1.p1 gnl/MRDRNA2_/MRDRNA2_84607_c0~~gnl/MRDRNA2_/MRDRNA2_84607_c0_seq1.p1  ORF type:complete len:274 (+),score=58.38 gnl/MRDRNA2_/MRDRNA2_84607_c0_seq1:116-937(+)
MGCAESKPAREDIPEKGTPCTFIIKADSMFSSNNFTIYDDNEAKWLHYEGKNFDDYGGEASLFLYSQRNGEPLCTLKVSGVEFEEIETKDKDDHGWFSDGDMKTKMKWKISRSVQVFDKKDGGKIGELTCSYEGIAEAKKDVDYEWDGDDGQKREVKWKKWARTQEVEYKMSIEGEDVKVSISPGATNVSFWDDKSDWQWQQAFQCGPFEVEYKEQWGADDVVIKTKGVMNPPIAVSLGFTLAYWMHPKRVEDDAADMAMKKLSDRLGFFGSW